MVLSMGFPASSPVSVVLLSKFEWEVDPVAVGREFVVLCPYAAHFPVAGLTRNSFEHASVPDLLSQIASRAPSPDIEVCPPTCALGRERGSRERAIPTGGPGMSDASEAWELCH